MNVYWLEQTEADIPEENDWLSESEAASLERLHFAKRRADWRLGRWTAKRALSVCLKMPAPPEVFIDNQPAAVTISLSHRSGIAACTVAISCVDLGCDLEIVEPHGDAFVSDYFTIEEKALVARASAADRDRLA